LTREPIAVIGAGRAGSALAAALAARRWPISAVCSRRRARAAALAGACARVSRRAAPRVFTDPASAVDGARVVILAVPDGALPALARRLARAKGGGRVVLHLSGALTTGALAPLARAGWNTGSLHPLMTFPRGARSAPALAGAVCAVDGSPGAAAAAARIARALDARAVRVRPAARAAWHLGACYAANYLGTLLLEAVDLMRCAGLGRAQAGTALRPLVDAAAAAVLTHGERALTGPVARGDAATVAAHARLLRGAPAWRTNLHASAVAATVERARAEGLITAAQARLVLAALASGGSRRAVRRPPAGSRRSSGSAASRRRARPARRPRA